MSDQLPPPPAATAPQRYDRSRVARQWWIGGALLVVAGTWLKVVTKLFSLNSHVSDVADDFFVDASAVQISQIANQAMLEGMAWISAGLAMTAVAWVVLKLATA